MEDYLRASIKEQDEIGRIEFAVKKAVEQAEKEAEKRKSVEITRNLKNQGVDIGMIADTTSLSKEEIENL